MEEGMRTPSVGPGPVDPSVLTQQLNHRSQLFDNDKSQVKVLKCIEHGQMRNQWLPSDKRMLQLLDKSGFGVVSKLPCMSLDWSLLTSLVERWRPETHTFHLRHGEMTPTLMDISLLTGLQSSGHPVTGVHGMTWNAECERILGVTPSNMGSDATLTLPWLRDTFQYLGEDADNRQVEMCTKAYILYVLGCSILCDKSGNKIHCKYLPLVDDLDNCGKYAWGAAALSKLYTSLDAASIYGATQLSGFLTFLQIWSWEHLHIGRPDGILPPNPCDPTTPLGCRWGTNRSWKGHAKIRDVNFYRNELDTQHYDQVVWQPYIKTIIKELPKECYMHSKLWKARTWLMCFESIGMHVPDRVMRQFGHEQHIPEKMEIIKLITARGQPDVDWSKIYADKINHWMKRKDYIVCPQPPLSENPEESRKIYMTWYWRITRRYLINDRVFPPHATYMPPEYIHREMVNVIFTERYLLNEWANHIDMPIHIRKHIRDRVDYLTSKIHDLKLQDPCYSSDIRSVQGGLDFDNGELPANHTNDTLMITKNGETSERGNGKRKKKG